MVHIDRLGNVKILNLLNQLGSIDRSRQFGEQVRQVGIQRRWCAVGDPTPAGDMRAAKSVCCPPSFCRL